MAKTPKTLLQDIEAFLSEQEMGASYFGKVAVGNSELVPRLRRGGRVWPETEVKVRSFMFSTLRDKRVTNRTRQATTGKPAYSDRGA